MKQDEPVAVLDPKQLSRIEAVHRGFMYQHLFATGCLLTAHGHATSVRIERDEDIEVISEDWATYIQVKTRSNPLTYNDFESAFLRFFALRDEHISGRRAGKAQFVFVSNIEPSAALLKRLHGDPLPPDVSLVWPDGSLGPKVDSLPPAWPNISTAASWCTRAAENLPLRLISSESLVWKVAAHVALAASGTSPYQDHQFRVEQLSALFEQILVQLQELPEPLHHYRPQRDEPVLESEAHLRIVCGFSGAGKTSWAAQAAAHSASSCVYYDAADTPAAALPSALVRESATQLGQANQVPLDRILAPGATGLESLRALDAAVGRLPQPVILVVDNAHNLSATVLDQVVKATRNFRLILLGHPVPMIAELEALTGVSREQLKGWPLEDVAAEASSIGCRGPIGAMERLRLLTGGSPLFVQGAARLAVGEYAGDIAELCDSLERGIHLNATAQELILARVFEALPQHVCHAAGLLSLSDVPLSSSEAVQLLRDCMGIAEPATAAILRLLRTHGLIQMSGASRVRVHGAMRILGKGHLESIGADSTKKGLEALRGIFLKSLLEQKDISRLGAFARLLASLNHLEPLIDLMGEELFHEMGTMPEVVDALERAVASGKLDQNQQFWAHDGLVFAAMKHGGEDAARDAQQSLDAMDRLLAQGVLTTRQQGSFWMKRMLYEAEMKNADGVMRALEQVEAVMPEDKAHIRIYRYNTAHALYKIGLYSLAAKITPEVIEEYYELLGITPLQITGMPQAQLWEALKKSGADVQDIKHLADALELLAMTHAKLGQRMSLERIRAMRFYEIAGAVDSVVRTGLDVADAFVWIHDFSGAREVMEKHVLPYVQKYRLTSKLLDARSLYAVILAYSGRFDDAQLEMERIGPMVGDAPTEMQQQFAGQLTLINELRVKGVPPQRPFPQIMPIQKSRGSKTPLRRSTKVERNELCPCGSGRKFKKCHGST